MPLILAFYTMKYHAKLKETPIKKDKQKEPLL